jgi:two-component system response regulator AtoC
MNDHLTRVMVIDRNTASGQEVGELLGRVGCEPLVFASAAEAVRRVHADRPAAVILDAGVPGVDGVSALAALKHADRDVPVIVMAERADAATVVDAMRAGAADFVRRPLDAEGLERPLVHAIRQRELSAELASLRRQVLSASAERLLLGEHPSIAHVRRLIERVADTDATVLVCGESGTGKELVARALHYRSGRRDRPFVKVNCAALPGELLESEMFGYERGAFSGAVQQKPGKLEFANHGTMFLDEIAEMPLPLQAKLLQVLQDGEFSRVGGKADVRVDARVVAATNQDLEQAVARGQFREDLLFRLNVVTIALPPLRDRREDIPAFVDHFLKRFSVHYNKPRPALSPETRHLIEGHSWPGNVRELENAVRRLVILGSEGPIQRELSRAVPSGPPAEATSVPAPRPAPASAPATGQAAEAAAAVTDAEPAPAASLKAIARAAARDAERVAIAAMLRRTHWNRKEAAEILGISYKALLYKIKEAGLDKSPTMP